MNLKKTVTFRVEPSRKELDSIYYHTPTGGCFKSYHIIPPSGWNNFYTDDNAIIEAGYLLCRFSPQQFYNLYNLVLNDKNRELLRIALTRITDEYAKFAIEEQEGKIEEPKFNFWSGHYFVTTRDNPLNAYSININLDSSHNLESCNSQRRIEVIRDFGYIHSYSKESKYDPIIDSAWIEHGLTDDIVLNFAQQSCQSDIEEYQKLLETINPNDQYYQAIINGGASYAADVKTLSRKLIK